MKTPDSRKEQAMPQSKYSYLDVRSSVSPLASLRLLAVAPKVVASLAEYRWRNRTLLRR